MKAQLIHKYLQGETSLAEERELTDLLQATRPEERTPEERALLHLLASAGTTRREEDLFTADHSEEYHRLATPQRRSTAPWLWTAAAAACLTGVFVLFCQQPPTGTPPPAGQPLAQETQAPSPPQRTPTPRGKALVPASQRPSPLPPDAPKPAAKPQAKKEEEGGGRLPPPAETRPETSGVIVDERDIPITRSENLAYTPEELELLKQQAQEAYLKWLDLEIQIAKSDLLQTVHRLSNLDE